MKCPYNFIDAKHGEIIMLPHEYKNPITNMMFDFAQLCGDYIVFGLSKECHFETMSGEYKTLRELCEEQRTK